MSVTNATSKFIYVKIGGKLLKNSQRKAIFANRHRSKISNGIQEKIDADRLTSRDVVQISSPDPLFKGGHTKSKFISHFETPDGKLIFWSGNHHPAFNVIRKIKRVK